MTSVDVVDELFVLAPPAAVAAELAGPARWRVLWPDLELEVVTDRGSHGVRWTATGALFGSMEVWLEPVLDGTLIHYYLRADLPSGRRAGRRRIGREIRARQRAAKAVAFGIKDRLEAGRPPGEPPAEAEGGRASAGTAAGGAGGVGTAQGAPATEEPGDGSRRSRRGG